MPWSAPPSSRPSASSRDHGLLYHACVRVPPLVTRCFLDSVIVAYLLITAGGMYITVTHEPLFVLQPLARYSYGMLAPYQGDSDWNSDIAVVAWQGNASVLLPVDTYFPGMLGERNVRMILSHIPAWETHEKKQAFERVFSQILTHERQAGRPYDRIDVYAEDWLRSPESYDARRPSARRFFLLSVR
jgi:hypothetical protein